MSYWHVCPHCGAYLDPGERCDCQRTEKPAAAHGSGHHEEGPAENTKTTENTKNTKQEGAA